MSSIKTGLQSEMKNRYCTSWFQTIINKKKKKGMKKITTSTLINQE